MTWELLLPYVMSAVTLTAIYFAGNKKPWAWLLSLGNQAIWGLWIYLTWPQASGLLPMCACLTVLYLRNWRRWKRADLGTKEAESAAASGGTLAACHRFSGGTGPAMATLRTTEIRKHDA